jgi:ribonuclease PH
LYPFSGRGNGFLAHVFKEVKILCYIVGAIEEEERMQRGSDYEKWDRELRIPTRQTCKKRPHREREFGRTFLGLHIRYAL